MPGCGSGVTQFDCTVGGLGGCPFAGQPRRPGNICTEELVLLCEEMGIDTGVDLDALIEVGRHGGAHRRAQAAERIAARRQPGCVPEEGGVSEPRPLAGLKVLEFSHTIMGPCAGLVLADLGADVVKVEPAPAGDHTRRLPGFAAGFFATFNRNKRSLALDLKRPRWPARRRTGWRPAPIIVLRELRARHDGAARLRLGANWRG